MTLKRKAEGRDTSRESNANWPSLKAVAPTKKMGKGGFNVHPGFSRAGPSHGGWQPPPTLQVGHKRTAVSSQSPKNTPTKVAWQLTIQYQLSQQDLQQPPLCIYLPSALMGAP